MNGIPATPIPGTAEIDPLITFARYQFLTKDTASDEGDFDQTLIDALSELQPVLNRTLLYAQYTERLYVYPKTGQVYPSACPLDDSKPVGTPGDPTGSTANYVIQGAGIYVGFFNPIPSLPVFQGFVPEQTDVTYWGGFTQSTLPYKFAKVIAKTCWFMLNPAEIDPVLLAGAKSVSVGGVSISGDLSAMVLTDNQLGRDISRVTRRQARAWQS